MRALVTGATGFIGSFLAGRLLRDGATVAILTRPGAKTWRIDPLLHQVTRIEGDLRDLSGGQCPPYGRVENQVHDFAPDTVFHLGWYGVAGSCRNDEEQIDANLRATLDLVRVALRAGCTTWIGLGSQAEYGPLNRPIAEDAPTRPTTTYGAVKLCAGLLAARLAADTDMRLAWLRVFSTYGPRDNPQWLIPYLVRTLLDGRKPSLTACEQTWDYLFVEDAAEAIHRVAVTTGAAGVFNLGSGQARPLRTVVERIRDSIDPSLSLGFGEVPYRPDQVMHLEADISRLTAVTGWTPRTPLDEGLGRTIAWHREQEQERHE